MAAISTFFLYGSFVRSVVAHEPNAGAAETNSGVGFDENSMLEEHIFNIPPNVNAGGDEITEAGRNSEVTEDSEILKRAHTPTPRTFVEKKADPNFPEILVKNIHELTNEERLNRGAKAYVFDQKLAEIARRRSEDMLARGYFSHTAPDGCGITCNFEASQYETLGWGENIARYEFINGVPIGGVADIFIEQWIKSSGHRDNLLSGEFTHHGVGVSVHAGTVIATVIFVTPQ